MRRHWLSMGLTLILTLVCGLLVAAPAYAYIPVDAIDGGKAPPAAVTGESCSGAGCADLSGVLADLHLPTAVANQTAPVQNEIEFFYRLLLSLVIAFAGLALVWAGFLYLTGGTSKAEQATARDLIQRTLTGLVMIGLVPLFFSVIANLNLVSDSLTMDDRPRILMEDVRLEVNGNSGNVPYEYWKALSDTTGGIKVGYLVYESRHNPAVVHLKGKVRTTNLSEKRTLSGGKTIWEHPTVYVRGDLLVGEGDGKHWDEGGWFAPVAIEGFDAATGTGDIEVAVSPEMISNMLGNPARIAGVQTQGTDAASTPVATKPVRIVVETATSAQWQQLMGSTLSYYTVFTPEYTPEAAVTREPGMSAFKFYMIQAFLWLFSMIARLFNWIAMLLVGLAFRPIYLDNLPQSASQLWLLCKSLAQIGILLVVTLWAASYMLGRKQSISSFLTQLFVALVGINAAPFFIQRLLDLNIAIVNSLVNVATNGRGLEGALTATSGWETVLDVVACLLSSAVSIAVAIGMLYVCLRYIVRYIEIIFWAIISPIVFCIGAYQGMGGAAVRTFTHRVVGAIFMQAVDSFILAIVLAFAYDGLAGQIIRLGGVLLIAKSSDLAKDLLGLDPSMSTGSAVMQGFGRAAAFAAGTAFKPVNMLRYGRDQLRQKTMKTDTGKFAVQSVDTAINRVRARQAFRQRYQETTGREYRGDETRANGLTKAYGRAMEAQSRRIDRRVLPRIPVIAAITGTELKSPEKVPLDWRRAKALNMVVEEQERLQTGSAPRVAMTAPPDGNRTLTVDLKDREAEQSEAARERAVVRDQERQQERHLQAQRDQVAESQSVTLQNKLLAMMQLQEEGAQRRHSELMQGILDAHKSGNQELAQELTKALREAVAMAQQRQLSQQVRLRRTVR